jgi:type IV pilus assembly protein PilW
MNRSSANSFRGFSLVELMVAMALSLVLLAGVLGVLYSSKVTYSENTRLARLQESARAAVEMILRDMRSGGFQGCGRPLLPEDFENNLFDPTALTHNYTQPLSGYEYDSATSTFQPALPAAITNASTVSDVVVIRGVRPGVPSFRTTSVMDDGDANVVVANPNSVTIPAGTPLIISNCERTTVFAASAASTTAGITTISHAAGTTGVANRIQNIGAFLDGAQVSPLNTVVYYVRQDAGRPPSLWRIIDDGAPVELIQGIERIEILYGEDTSGDGLADRYVPANTAGLNWNRITSASISVLVRSVEEYGQAEASRTFTMLDEPNFSFNDRFVRTVFTTTATLRNRTP